MVKCRRMKRPQFMSENWIFSWQWKSSRIRQQFYRQESFAMNMDILTSGSTVKNHISFKTVFGYSVIRKTSWFINEFFLKLALFNFHDTFEAGKWSSCIFLKLVYFTNHNRVKRQWDSNKGWSEWDRFPSSTCVKFTCWTNRKGWPVVAQANPKSKAK